MLFTPPLIFSDIFLRLFLDGAHNIPEKKLTRKNVNKAAGNLYCIQMRTGVVPSCLHHRGSPVSRITEKERKREKGHRLLLHHPPISTKYTFPLRIVPWAWRPCCFQKIPTVYSATSLLGPFTFCNFGFSRIVFSPSYFESLQDRYLLPLGGILLLWNQCIYHFHPKENY